MTAWTDSAPERPLDNSDTDRVNTGVIRWEEHQTRSGVRANCVTLDTLFHIPRPQVRGERLSLLNSKDDLKDTVRSCMGKHLGEEEK